MKTQLQLIIITITTTIITTIIIIISDNDIIIVIIIISNNDLHCIQIRRFLKYFFFVFKDRMPIFHLINTIK